ncbi:MAG: PSD1 and planctomycete cytochrome C domain-containing protein [Verrucomicrobiota bacterium]
MTAAKRCAALATVLASAFAASAAEPSSEQLNFFEKLIRPMLAEHCYECHSIRSAQLKGGLLLDSKAGWERGGNSGPVIIPGDPANSRLIRVIKQPDTQSPPEYHRLSTRQLTDLERWVTIGAPDPRTQPLGPVAESKSAFDFAKERQFWAYQPVKDPPVPKVRNSRWARTPVDHFILARLEASKLKPNPDADKRTLLRRATYDLTGLPPTPDEINAFLADKSTEAFEKVVDRLLASPAYGERWGRHWLDLVRYADTSGCNADVPIPDAYRYRNYVIDSFNRDKPYDLFLREQIAGDLLPSQSEQDRYENIIATGYLAISRRFSSLGEEPHLTFDDTIDNVGKTVLGLTLACARCHDHKYDPVPTEDYYALYGIFSSTRYSFPGTEIPRHRRDLIALVPADRYEKEIRPFEDKLAAIDQTMDTHYARKVSLDTGKERNAADAAWKKTNDERDALLKSAPSYDRAYAAAEGTPANTRVQIKGNPLKLGREVPRGFLQILGGQHVPASETGSGRRQLADWLADPRNPLTARVMVNRIWLYHFGEGLVRTPNDFGTRGQPPSHPELLDYLATRFIAGGWSIKAMHKQLMLSHAYQISTTDDPSAALKDADNRLLWKFNRRRLDAEEIRDSLLAVSGALDRTPGGPHPFKPEWEWRYTQHKPFVDDFESNRRSVYLLYQRIRLQPILGLFDGADPNAATGQRPLSTTAIQALFMMNDPLAHQQAERFADRLLAAPGTTASRIDLAYQLAFARPATKDELRDGVTYLAGIEQKFASAQTSADKLERAAWASYCRVLYSSNEFIYLD